jgi:hypothetical protein
VVGRVDRGGQYNIFFTITHWCYSYTINFYPFLLVTSTYKPCGMGELSAILLVGGFAGLYYWNLSRAAGNLIYQPGTIVGFSMNGYSPTVTAELIVQNTSNIEFTISSLAGNVTSNGTQIGNISNFTPVRVLANSQGALPITLALQPIGLAFDIITSITNGMGSHTVRVQGSVNANGFQNSFSLEYKIGI